MDHRCPGCGLPLPQGVPAWVRHLTVGQAMTRELVTLGPEDSLMRAVEVMRLKRIRRIPVLLGGQLIGLLGEGDLKRAEPSTLSESEADFNRVMEETPISRIMIKDPVTVEEDALLAEALVTMVTHKFGTLPVLRGGVLVGILTDSDLLRCLADLLRHGG